MEQEKPKIVDRKGKVVNLYPGKYSFCTCGLSSDQPFCDGAHEGTSFVPKRFSIDEPTSVSLCMCKYTKSAPFCDGEHRQLPSD